MLTEVSGGYRIPVTSRARSDIASSQLLQPESMPYGDRSRIASIRRIFPRSSLNISASCQVQGVVGPAVTARPVGVVKWRVSPAMWSKKAKLKTRPRS